MPAVPISASVAENGTRATLPVSQASLVMGTCSAGTDNQIYSIGSTTALISTHGVGPLVQLAALYLNATRRPIYTCRINDSVAPTMSAVAYTRVGASTGTATNNASAPVDAFSVIVEILSTGTLAGTPWTYRYSLDGGDNNSGTLVGAVGITLGASGIVLTMADGGGPTTGFQDGDLITFTTTAPAYNSTDLGNALSGWINSDVRVRRIHPAMISVTPSSLYATIQTNMTTAFNGYRYARCLVESDDQGGGEAVADWQAGVITDFATEEARALIRAGWHEVAMPLQVGGITLQLRRPAAWVIGPREAAIDISRDPGAIKDGSLAAAVLESKTASNPTGLGQDGRLYTAFEGRGISTVQTYVGRTGVFCGGGFTRVQSTSDYYRSFRGYVIDAVLETAYDDMLDFINQTVAANANGTIADVEADAIEAKLNGSIEQNFVRSSPSRISEAADGVYAQVDRTNNIVTTEELRVTYRLIPKGIIGTITLTVGYALE